ncbi:MAG: hypothetical protein EOP45_07555 [Sphingobacteriaceae bacterium]|nr:MAG: hypothetical protein EOP45_07555 [Sphingobacteriaceae bacterium]
MSNANLYNSAFLRLSATKYYALLELLSPVNQATMLSTIVMLSLSKHLYSPVEWLNNGAVEMLRQAQHDNR